jgi:hypothetical protein
MIKLRAIGYFITTASLAIAAPPDTSINMSSQFVLNNAVAAPSDGYFLGYFNCLGEGSNVISLQYLSTSNVELATIGWSWLNNVQPVSIAVKAGQKLKLVTPASGTVSSKGLWFIPAQRK